MQVRFWGVRGSIASPGTRTAGVGGNTSSVEVTFDGGRILLDAGTGLRALGEKLANERVDDVAILLSHLHWDHIQGLPFFRPVYTPGTRVAVYGQAPLRAALEQQMSAPVFPVKLADLPGRVVCEEVRAGAGFTLFGATVRTAQQNHPGGSLAYRIDHGGRSIVYATDTEHYACVDPALLALCQGADVLIYDAQYTPEEYCGEKGRARLGWGHSTYVAATELANAASVRELVLFHHEPERSDAEIAEIEADARSLFLRTVAAREGACIEVGPRSVIRAA